MRHIHDCHTWYEATLVFDDFHPVAVWVFDEAVAKASSAHDNISWLTPAKGYRAKLIEIINTEAKMLDADCFEIIANCWLCLWLVRIVGIGKELEDHTTGVYQLMNT